MCLNFYFLWSHSLPRKSGGTRDEFKHALL
jgi:hypothetical protein